MQPKQSTVFFHKPSKKEDISPLLLQKLNINNSEIERSGCLKFLGVLQYENLYWKELMKYINIPFCHCIIYKYIPVLITEILHGQVQPEQTFKKYTVIRNMLSVNMWKNFVFIHQINSNTAAAIFFQ